MKEQLARIEHFYRSLDPAIRAALDGVSQSKQYRKGEYLLKVGEVCRYSFMVASGAVRQFFLHDGKEITTELIFTDDVALSMHSYILVQPSREYIQAVTDATVTTIHRDGFAAIKKQYPKLSELELMLTELYALWLETRILEMRTLDATARYQKLLAEQPHVVQHIPLTHVASYLGISLETLSRIRARI